MCLVVSICGQLAVILALYVSLIREESRPLAGGTCNRLGDNEVQCLPYENNFYQPHPAQSVFLLRSSVAINVATLQN